MNTATNNLFEPLLENATPDMPAILPLYGGAEKPVSQMSREEFDEVAQTVYRKVREQAFSRGLPVVIERMKQLIKEYADGHVEVIKP